MRAPGCGSGLQRDDGGLCALLTNTGYDSGFRKAAFELKKKKVFWEKLKRVQMPGPDAIRGTIQTTLSSF